MARDTWNHGELFEGLAPSPAFVAELVRLGLIRVVAKDAKGASLYAGESKEQLKQVLSLVELGYKPKDIAAISQKVGLPKRRRRLFSKIPTYLRLEALAEKTGIDKARIERWIGEGMLTPDLLSEGGESLYNRESMSRLKMLDELTSLGMEEERLQLWVRLMPFLVARRGFEREKLDAAGIELSHEELETIFTDLKGRLGRVKAACRVWEKRHSKARKRLKAAAKAAQKPRLRRSRKASQTQPRKRTKAKTSSRKKCPGLRPF